MLVAVFLYGIVIGSFLNVLIYRLPRKLSIIRPRSKCPQCGSKIQFYDNVPIFSYVILRGK
ncbi:MAG: prepilin peptidase, partial [candidate division Zixibacteria bacterium]